MRKLTIILWASCLLLLTGCSAANTGKSENDQAPATIEQASLPTETSSPKVAKAGWQDAYFSILEEEEATHIQLIDLDADGIPELFLSRLGAYNSHIFRGYSYKDGAVSDIRIPDDFMPMEIGRYRERETGETIWLAGGMFRSGENYEYKWNLMDFRDFSDVKETLFWGYEETLETEGIASYRLLQTPGDMTKQQMEEAREQAFSGYEPVNELVMFSFVEEFRTEGGLNRDLFHTFVRLYDEVKWENILLGEKVFSIRNQNLYNPHKTGEHSIYLVRKEYKNQVEETGGKMDVGYLQVIGGPEEAIRKGMNEKLKASAFDEWPGFSQVGQELTVTQEPYFYQEFLSVREWSDYFGADVSRPVIDQSAITFRIGDGTQVSLSDILTVGDQLKEVLYSGDFVNNGDGLTYEECVELGLYDRLWAAVSAKNNDSGFYLDENKIGFIIGVPAVMGYFRNFEMTWERLAEGPAEEETETFRDIADNLGEQELTWEAYYNATGERAVMYVEDGTEYLFLSPVDSRVDVKGRDDMVLVMRNDQFFAPGFKACYGRATQQSADAQYFLQTAEYYLNETELMAMNQTDLEIALGEIYARHGKRITDPFLQAVFSQKTWYLPKYEETDFADRQETLLNEYEKENAKAILSIQEERGFAKNLSAEYKVPRSIVSGSSIDLDGDGGRDSVSFDFMHPGPVAMANKYLIFINMKADDEAQISGEIDQMPTAVYAASLDGKTTQLIVSGAMNDGKPKTDIYVYQQGKANLAGRIDADNLEIVNDGFWAYQYDVQQGVQKRAKYIFENKTVTDTGIREGVEGSGNQEDRVKALIDGFDFAASHIGYGEVVSALEEKGISWDSRLNISGERLDLICDDGTVLVFLDTGTSEKELVMAGDRWRERGFQSSQVHGSLSQPDEFYYPETSVRLLTASELDRMNQTEMWIARNEIYARHGRRFETPFLCFVFGRKSWYKPKYDGPDFSGRADQLLNGFEKENLTLLVAAEDALAE